MLELTLCFIGLVGAGVGGGISGGLGFFGKGFFFNVAAGIVGNFVGRQVERMINKEGFSADSFVDDLEQAFSSSSLTTFKPYRIFQRTCRSLQYWDSFIPKALTNVSSKVSKQFTFISAFHVMVIFEKKMWGYFVKHTLMIGF